jgi:hypothetical protein
MGPDAKSLIERARRDGPSAAEREQIRRNVKAALAGGLAVAGTSAAAAAQAGAAGAVHGLGASLSPLGVLGWLGAGSAVSAVVLGGAMLVTKTPSAKRVEPPHAASVAAAPSRAERNRALPRASDSVVTPSEPASARTGPSAAGQQRTEEVSAGAEDRTAPSRSDSIRAEYALLEAAHRALEQGDTDTALQRLAEHERQFGQGRLTEERQGIRTLALCVAGRPGAHELGAAFLRDYPHSLLGPRIRHECHFE